VKLPDFLEFEPFNQMRESLGTDKLGHFEFFDPNTQLTGDERSELSRLGTSVEGRFVRLLSDHSLGYKNSRVVVIDQDVVHLTQCANFELSDSYEVAIPGKILSNLKPCIQCLHDLRYQGFDLMRERKKAQSDYVLEHFTFDAFFKHKKLYPVNCVELTIHLLIVR